MTRTEMDRLIEEHPVDEKAGDTAGCVGVYTDDVVHDVVGAPHGPLHGTRAAQGFYEYLTANVTTQEMVAIRSHYGDDFRVIEHDRTGTDDERLIGRAALDTAAVVGLSGFRPRGGCLTGPLHGGGNFVP